MKNLLLFFALITSFWAKSQTLDTASWSPAGATWIYRGISPTSQLYYTITYLKDTIFQGVQVKKFDFSSFQYVGLGTMYRQPTVWIADEFLYKSNDTVFWWNDGQFQMLYNFNQILNTSWIIYQNDYSVCISPTLPTSDTLIAATRSVETYSNLSFDVLYPQRSTYWSFGGGIAKNLGALNSFFPQVSSQSCLVSDGAVSNMQQLECYFDSVRGYVNVDISVRPCGELISSIYEFRNNPALEKKVNIYPNPASEFIFVNWEQQVATAEVKIFNILGQFLQNCTVENNSQLNLSHLEQGIYFINLSFRSYSQTFKIQKL